MRGIHFLDIYISMDFGNGHIPENFHINPLSLKANAFIHEATDMIWNFGTATHFTKFEMEGFSTGGVGMEATNA